MKFLISASAGRIGYAEGQQFIFASVDQEPIEWHSTGIGKYGYAMLHSSDMTQIEAETVDQAVEVVRKESSFFKTLMLLDIMLDPIRGKIDDEITDLFVSRYETGDKPRINAILHDAPLHPKVTVDALKAAVVAQPRLREALGIIIEAHGVMNAPSE
jgi:hypothetical protein